MSRIVKTEPIEPYVYSNLVAGVDYDWPDWSPDIQYHWIVAAPHIYVAVELPDGTTFAQERSLSEFKFTAIHERLSRTLRERS